MKSPSHTTSTKCQYHATASNAKCCLGVKWPFMTRSQITTSHVERQNLTMRMSMRRFTRLTNGFSKKVEGLRAAVALHFAHYNFVRIHSTLRVTPAMAAGVSGKVWALEELVERTAWTGSEG